MLEKRDLIFNLIKANDDDQTIEGVFSTGDVDRGHGPHIDQESWDLKNFKKNPVVLFAHNSMFGADTHIVIGKVVKIGLNEKGNLAGKIQFAINEGVGVYGDFIKTIYNLYKGKFMRAFSVGFIIGEIVVDKKKNTKMVNNELLELSCVPIGMNALALAKQKGFDLSAIEKLLPIDKEHKEKKEKEKEFTLFVDKKEKQIKVLEGSKEIGKGIILKQFRDLLFGKMLEVKISAEIDKENHKLIIKQGEKVLKEIDYIKYFEEQIQKSKKVVTECSDKRKVKSPNKGVKTINKIIRTLLKERREMKSKTEKK